MVTKEYECRHILEQFAENPFCRYFMRIQRDMPSLSNYSSWLKDTNSLKTASLLNRLYSAILQFPTMPLLKHLFLHEKPWREGIQTISAAFITLETNFPNPDLLVYLHRNVDILLKISKREAGILKRIFHVITCIISRIHILNTSGISQHFPFW